MSAGHSIFLYCLYFQNNLFPVVSNVQVPANDLNVCIMGGNTQVSELKGLRDFRGL